MGSKERSIKRAAARTAAVDRPTLAQILQRIAATVDDHGRLLGELEKVVEEHEKKLNAKEVN